MFVGFSGENCDITTSTATTTTVAPFVDAFLTLAGNYEQLTPDVIQEILARIIPILMNAGVVCK